MPVSARSRRALAASLLGVGLALSGCQLRSTAGQAADGPDTLGFVNGGTTQFHTCLQRSIEQEARNNLVDLYTADSGQDSAGELANIEDMIARDVDALIVQTVDVDALEKHIARARDADIPVFLTSVVPEDTSDILGAVVVDLKAAGRLDAEWIAEDAAGRPVTVGIVAGAPGAASDLLVGGFTSALPDNAEVVAEAPGMYDPAEARRVAEDMIRSHPDLTYAFVANEQMAFAVRKAFDAAGAGQVKIVTVNGTDEGLAALKDGRFSATVANSAAETGELAVTNTIALLRGEKTEADKIAKTPLRLVTKDNADLVPLYCPPEDF
ncbi:MULTISPECIES: sugar ABC transporter substrate-binding protein [unclassified Streptomyces]|uniref:sugar ABC transporter substrate-binding protein n=1 Tax=unclassified Streptomyces TaxID=2593676 RepID=UPI00093F68A6|nr:sugar ABC transporter substrate-binding protein [Streptomyces sp. TSRI0107]OKJ89640.1 sugar ABC transporter substrate-binding protein [Streptomyces sp. TSRI0107]